MQKLSLTKENVKIDVENNDDKLSIHFYFTDDKKDNLTEYLYLLDKIDEYLKSGEYEIKNICGE